MSETNVTNKDQTDVTSEAIDHKPPMASDSAPIVEVPPVKTDEAPSPRHAKRFSRLLGAVIGIMVLAFIAGAFGSYVVVSSGLVDATKTITNNRDKIVLQQGEVVADVAKKVNPSVVSITTEGKAASTSFFW